MKHHPAGVNTFCLRHPRKSLGWRGSQISSILTCGLPAHLPASAFLCWELTPSSWCDLGEESSFFRGEWVALKPGVYKNCCKLRGRGQEKPSRAVCVDTRGCRCRSHLTSHCKRKGCMELCGRRGGSPASPRYEGALVQWLRTE